MKQQRFFWFSHHTLTLRVALLSALWGLVALVVVAWVGAVFYRDANERNFERLLTTYLYRLVGYVSVSGKGALQGKPDLGNMRFFDPASGWYWEVVAISPSLHGHLHSTSLNKGRIISPGEKQSPFDKRFMRHYRSRGLHDEEILVVESDIVLDAANRVARFRVMGNLAEVGEQFHEFWLTMRWYLLCFGLGSILINMAIIVYALRPLVRIRQALEMIRAGKSDRIDTRLPAEIAPIAKEMNALIDNNRRIVERFRTQVGNLAHSLKTPLAVLINEAAHTGGQNGQLIRQQATAMQAQINHYLQRARIASQRDSVVHHTAVKPVIERTCRVIRKLAPQKHVHYTSSANSPVFVGEKQDLEEMVGNLLENAAKWAKSRVNITLDGLIRSPQGLFFEIRIEDDGPGLGQDEMNEALKRGHRLDESKPGTGLGLSIVLNTVHEYGGTLSLGTSALGGLSAAIRLPLTHHEAG